MKDGDITRCATCKGLVVASSRTAFEAFVKAAPHPAPSQRFWQDPLCTFFACPGCGRMEAVLFASEGDDRVVTIADLQWQDGGNDPLRTFHSVVAHDGGCDHAIRTPCNLCRGSGCPHSARVPCLDCIEKGCRHQAFRPCDPCKEEACPTCDRMRTEVTRNEFLAFYAAKPNGGRPLPSREWWGWFNRFWICARCDRAEARTHDRSHSQEAEGPVPTPGSRWLPRKYFVVRDGGCDHHVTTPCDTCSVTQDDPITKPGKRLDGPPPPVVTPHRGGYWVTYRGVKIGQLRRVQGRWLPDPLHLAGSEEDWAMRRAVALIGK